MLKKIFSRSTNSPQNIIVVSGLPRSGTSMMMKMLVEGGLEIVTDAIRTADNDNPNGYYEYEPVKKLISGQADWLAGCKGKVVKVISSLLEYLPARHRYKVIFMERTIQEVLDSQQKMLTNRNESNPIDDAEIANQFTEHLKSVKYWLARQPNLEVLYVNYNQMVAAPEVFCGQLAEFLELPLAKDKMAAVPNQRLYRNRAK